MGHFVFYLQWVQPLFKRLLRTGIQQIMFISTHYTGTVLFNWDNEFHCISTVVPRSPEPMKYSVFQNENRKRERMEVRHRVKRLTDRLWQRRKRVRDRQTGWLTKSRDREEGKGDR